MSLLTVSVLIIGYSSAFLIHDFNQTSSLSGQHASVEDSIRDLMALIVEEKRMRFQLETRLNDAENKIKKMHLYNLAVSDELENEKRKIEQLRTTCTDLKRQLNKTTSTNIIITPGPQTVKTDMDNDITRIQGRMTQLNRTLMDKFIDMNNQLQMINQTFASTRGESVGFSVYRPVYSSSYTASALRFQDVIYNENDVFNTTAGVFTCQRPGLYLFIFTAVKLGNTDKTYCSFYKNDQLSASSTTAIAEGGIVKFSSGTNSILFRLQAGDKVKISGCNHQAGYFAWETSFTGILISSSM